MSVGQTGGPWPPGPPRRKRSVPGLIGRIALYVLAGIGGLTTVLALGLAAAVLWFEDVPEDLPDKIVLRLNLNDGAPERHDANPFTSTPSVATLRDIVDALARAKQDPSVVGVVARIEQAQFGVARAQELRDAVQDFARSGKPTAVFSQSLGGLSNGTMAYFVASAFDEIWLQPSGGVGLTGFALEIPFFKGALEKLEVETRLEQRQEYKSAGESIERAALSEPARDSLQVVVDDWLAQLADGIAGDRGLSPEAVRGLIDDGPYLAGQAVDAGLVDRTGYWDEFLDDHSERDGMDDAEPVGVLSYLAGRGRPGQDDDAPLVALVQGIGAIGAEQEDDGPFGRRGFGAATVAGTLHNLAEDDTVDAVILRVDSPGGAYVPSDIVWRAMHKVRAAGKPVIASMGDTAASGGYFVAMAADRIVAQPGTVTGSIGVYGGKFVTEGLWNKLGITWDGVHAGARATMWSSVSDFPPGALARFQQQFDFVYDDFASKAAADRGLSPDAIDRAARGRVWTGVDALEVGLVDVLGGLPAAKQEVRLALGLDADDALNVQVFPRPKSRLELLTEWVSNGGPLGGAAVATTTDEIVQAVSHRLAPVLGNLDPLLEPREGLLQLPPISIR